MKGKIWLISIILISILLLSQSAMTGYQVNADNNNGLIRQTEEDTDEIIFPKGNLSEYINHRELVKKVLNRIDFDQNVQKIKEDNSSHNPVEDYERIEVNSDNIFYLSLAEDLEITKKNEHKENITVNITSEDGNNVTLNFSEGMVTLERKQKKKYYSVMNMNESEVHLSYFDDQFHVSILENTSSNISYNSISIYFRNERGTKIRLNYEAESFIDLEIYNISKEDRNVIDGDNLTEKSYHLAEKIGPRDKLKPVIIEEDNTVKLLNKRFYFEDYPMASNTIFSFRYNSEKELLEMDMNLWYDLEVDKTNLENQIEENFKRVVSSKYNVSVDDLSTLEVGEIEVMPLKIVKYRKEHYSSWSEKGYEYLHITEGLNERNLTDPVLVIDTSLDNRKVNNYLDEEQNKLEETKYGSILVTLYIQNDTLIAYQVGQLMEEGTSDTSPPGSSSGPLSGLPILTVVIISITLFLGVIGIMNKTKDE